MTMMFRFTPYCKRIRIALKRDSGMAITEINAVLKLNRNRASTAITSKPPISRCPVILPTERSM